MSIFGNPSSFLFYAIVFAEKEDPKTAPFCRFEVGFVATTWIGKIISTYSARGFLSDPRV